jgi:hypothetical protein
MQKETRFFFAFISALLVTIVLYASAAVALDPLRIFGTSGFNRKNFEPDARYLQIEYLKHHAGPDAFVLGSSRVNFYDVADLRRLTGRRFYNLSASIEGFQGIRNKVEWLLKHRRVDMVVIGLDYDLYDVLEDRSDLQHVDHPEIDGQWPVAFYARALLIPPALLAECVLGNLKSQVGYRFDLGSGQFWVRPGGFDQGEHLVDRERLAPALAFDELRQTLRMLDAAHVLHVEVVAPYSESRLMQFDSARYLRWLHDVVTVAGNVWNFGDDGPIEQDKSNYLDISHFDGAVGRWVVKRIFGTDQRGVPDNFGVRVSVRNLAAQLARVRVALAQARRRTHELAGSSKLVTATDADAGTRPEAF